MAVQPMRAKAFSFLLFVSLQREGQEKLSFQNKKHIYLELD